MSWLQFFSELVPHVAWPAAAVLIAFLLRPVLRELAPSVQSFGPSGVSLFPPSQRAIDNHAAEDSEVDSVSLEELDNPNLIRIEKSVSEELDKVAEGEREKRLLRAVTYRIYDKILALAYAEIFTSQIEAMELLNSRSISRYEAEERFNEFKSRHPSLQEWSLDAFLAYLQNFDFVEERNGRFSITQTGRDFLIFLDVNGLPRHRPL